MKKQWVRYRPPAKYTLDEVEELRWAYENDDESIEVLADRFSTSPHALRVYASRHGWNRLRSVFRKGVTPKTIPEEKRATAQVMWVRGIPAEMIGRWIGVSENTARKLCNQEFGARDLRVLETTRQHRRDETLLEFRLLGATLADLSRMWGISEKRCSAIIAKQAKRRGMKRTGGKFWAARKKRSLREVKKLYEEQRDEFDYQLYEACLHDLIVMAARYFKVKAAAVLWPDRGHKEIAKVRRVVGYVLHAECGVGFAHVGRMIGRHASTIRYHVRKTEDGRDEDLFDDTIIELAQEFIAHLRERFNWVPPWELYKEVQDNGSAKMDDSAIRGIEPRYAPNRRVQPTARSVNDNGGIIPSVRIAPRR